MSHRQTERASVLLVIWPCKACPFRTHAAFCAAYNPVSGNSNSLNIPKQRTEKPSMINTRYITKFYLTCRLSISRYLVGSSLDINRDAT
ncbi:hypothetical protein F5B19DRAFT_263711 [Rostrohypoxylon terebratum]|nr:hypothetical protein F5B19DRAFT_263711 [Rostrohypoxylon terebratum]